MPNAADTSCGSAVFFIGECCAVNSIVPIAAEVVMMASAASTAFGQADRFSRHPKMGRSRRVASAAHQEHKMALAEWLWRSQKVSQSGNRMNQGRPRISMD